MNIFLNTSDKPRRILITGGRAPVILDLARILHRAGHKIYAAESMPLNLLATSNVVSKKYVISQPRFNLKGFQEDLTRIIEVEKIDLLIPTQEEIYYVAKIKNQLPSFCKVFVSDFDKIHDLHNKWIFIQKAAAQGFKVPITYLVKDETELEKNQWNLRGKVVLKPVYSRFGAKTLITDIHRIENENITIHPNNPWVLQEFISGRQICTYSVVKNGEILAHCSYTSDFAWGLGAFIFLKNIIHQSSYEWVKQFVHNEKFNGQIGFDFIENNNGEIYVIECNPRATSGINLFYNHSGFANVFFGKSLSPLFPKSENASMVGVAMLSYAIANVRNMNQLQRWWASFKKGRDVIFSWNDPWPYVMQFIITARLIISGWSKGMSATEFTTEDIEYNGK